MKRILQVVGKMNIGGAEQLLMNVYRNIDRSKVQFDFLTFYSEGERGYFDTEIESLGGKIVNIRKPNATSPFRNIADVRRILQHERYDAIHTHIGSNCVYALIAAKKENVSIRVAHSHNTPVPGKSFLASAYDAVLRFFLNYNLTKCAACSEAAAKYRFTSKNINHSYRYVPNSIDFSSYLERYDIEPIRKELLVAQDTFIILQVGNVKKQKNQLFTLDLVSDYCRMHKNTKFIFVGRIEGKYAEQFTNKIAKDKIEDNVILLGQRTDIPQLMAAADAMIMPSLWEGLGIVLIEAQASGLPCVVSEAIQKEADIDLGLITKCSLTDKASWLEALENCRDKKKPNTEERAHIVSSSNFNLNNTVKCFEELYEI